MDKVNGRLTVYFEEPFWVGIFEHIEDGKLSVAKVTFGVEPKDYEVQEYIQKYYFGLKFSPAVEAIVKDIKRNPKRMQRSAKKQMLIQKYYFGLKFSPAVEAIVKDIKRNPKRMQRSAKKQMLETGISTKSQLALKLQQEQNKHERKERSRKKKEAEEQRMFELKQLKKREKHKGH